MKYIDLYIALYDYRAQNEEELSFEKNDSLYILDKENPDWYKAQTIDHLSGYIPTNYIEKKSPIGLVQALFDYEANATEELDFKKDEQMILYEKEETWYLVATMDGKLGLAPYNYLQSKPCPASVCYPYLPTEPEEVPLVPDQPVLVLAYDDPDWWKVELETGLQGLVPASYLRLIPPGQKDPAKKSLPALGCRPTKQVNLLDQSQTDTASHLQKAAQEKETERRLMEEKRQAAEREEKRQAAEREEERQAAEREEKRKALEREEKRKALERKSQRQAAEREEKRKALERESQRQAAERESQRQAAEREGQRQAAERESQRQGQQLVDKKQQEKERKELEQKMMQIRENRQQVLFESNQRQTRPIHDSYQHVQIVDPLITLDQSRPNPSRVRQWTDNTGEFRVEAELMSCQEGKVRLFKTNGVRIELLANKLCREDQVYLEQMTGVLLKTPQASAGRFSWLGYFKQLNIPHEASVVYAQTFEANRLEAHDVESLSPINLRALGMTENHVRRLQCFIESRQVEPASEDELHNHRQGQRKVRFGQVDFIQDRLEQRQQQIEQDERLARQLQEEETNRPLPSSHSAAQTPWAHVGNSMWEPSRPPQLPQRTPSSVAPPPLPSHPSAPLYYTSPAPPPHWPSRTFAPPPDPQEDRYAVFRSMDPTASDSLRPKRDSS